MVYVLCDIDIVDMMEEYHMLEGGDGFLFPFLAVEGYDVFTVYIKGGHDDHEVVGFPILGHGGL